MTSRHFSAVLSTLASACLAIPIAYADVYTWTDPSGRVNVSNLPPPEGTRVTNVVRENPPTPAQLEARREAARLAEVQALTERVRQLEYEVESSARQPAIAMAPPVAYAPPIAVPQIVQYVEQAAPQPQYVANAPMMNPWGVNSWCDPTWISCSGAWLGPQLYPAFPAIVVRTGNFKRGSGGHGPRAVVNPRPVNPPPPGRKR